MTYDNQTNREWWAQRWVDVLESFGWIRRLERARNYAREGNVLEIQFHESKVQALVQGTAPDPYRVSLSLDPFDDEQWQYVIESLSERAIFSAKLLAGEMPQNIEEVFTANGLSLFPLTKFDIHSKCSCPDPANPCKHIGAVYYLLGDRFSEDPFVLFQLRGRTKDQIIAALRQTRSSQTDEPTDLPEAPAPLKLDLKNFWQYDEQLEPSLVVITPPPSSETVLDLLGAIPIKLEAGSAAGSLAANQVANPAANQVANPAANQAAHQASQLALEHLKAIYAQVSQQAVMTAMTTGSQD